MFIYMNTAFSHEAIRHLLRILTVAVDAILPCGLSSFGQHCCAYAHGTTRSLLQHESPCIVVVLFKHTFHDTVHDAVHITQVLTLCCCRT